MKIKTLIIALLFLPFGSFADDGDQILSLEEFILMVMESHPIAQQTRLIRYRGELSEREGRGGFDPKLVSNYETKDYKDTDYYQLWDSYLQIPTITGIEIKAGYEVNDGVFLNPENSVPSNGLYYAGLSVPLGRGFFLNNPEKINLEKSKLKNLDLQNQSIIVLNNLLLDANQQYWNWYASMERLELARENIEVIQERFDGIRQAVLNGENASIDSIETLIQVQLFGNMLRKAEVDYQNSLLRLSNFLWENDSINYAWTPDFPLNPSSPQLDQLISFASENHPELRSLSIDNSVLDLERKWNAEQLKPLLNLNYNFLVEPNGEGSEGNLSTNNYKGGVEFQFPLFIRKERAKLKLTKTKIDENQLKLKQKMRELSNKIEQNYNKLLVIERMIYEQEQIVNNYQTLLEGEQTKFDNGESSVFLINSRENQKIKAEQKLIDLKASYGMTLGLLDWSSGKLAYEMDKLFALEDR